MGITLLDDSLEEYDNSQSFTCEERKSFQVLDHQWEYISQKLQSGPPSNTGTPQLLPSARVSIEFHVPALDAPLPPDSGVMDPTVLESLLKLHSLVPEKICAVPLVDREETRDVAQNKSQTSLLTDPSETSTEEEDQTTDKRDPTDGVREYLVPVRTSNDYYDLESQLDPELQDELIERLAHSQQVFIFSLIILKCFLFVGAFTIFVILFIYLRHAEDSQYTHV
eukprot:NODE_1115_length_1005_cov_247.813212_g1070_i0.p1 GENE.NODE_1115_length_1005_cov_247.813212_g1070_i0~~NODE_1115_length_1005_cov_247.813212_g1070_i0.p1  ORF type:complete len:251 (-),score=53.39 NODE_1115_length_1005_cov_247.813212_g1070_i0:252-923(-)